MKFASFATLATLATSVSAGKWKDWCLTDAALQRIIDNSIIFLQHFDVAAANATAYATFAPDITETGDSINSLRGDPVSCSVFSLLLPLTLYFSLALLFPQISANMLVTACPLHLFQSSTQLTRSTLATASCGTGNSMVLGLVNSVSVVSPLVPSISLLDLSTDKSLSSTHSPGLRMLASKSSHQHRR